MNGAQGQFAMLGLSHVPPTTRHKWEATGPWSLASIGASKHVLGKALVDGGYRGCAVGLAS